jgi:hypothetical protein
MIPCIGNIWSVWQEADLFLITTNSTLTSGRLVMGRGIAREARDRFPGLDYTLGMHIDWSCGNQGTYGLFVSPLWPEKKLGLFQVKRHFSQQADLELITYSTRLLRDWCIAHPDASVHLNFPGIGNGRRPITEVMPIIAQLPDNVQVWRR